MAYSLVTGEELSQIYVWRQGRGEVTTAITLGA